MLSPPQRGQVGTYVLRAEDERVRLLVFGEWEQAILFVPDPVLDVGDRLALVAGYAPTPLEGRVGLVREDGERSVAVHLDEPTVFERSALLELLGDRVAYL